MAGAIGWLPAIRRRFPEFAPGELRRPKGKGIKGEAFVTRTSRSVMNTPLKAKPVTAARRPQSHRNQRAHRKRKDRRTRQSHPRPAARQAPPAASAAQDRRSASTARSTARCEGLRSGAACSPAEGEAKPARRGRARERRPPGGVSDHSPTGSRPPGLDATHPSAAAQRRRTTPDLPHTAPPPARGKTSCGNKSHRRRKHKFAQRV